MSKIVSYLWSHKGVEYNLVTEHDVKKDTDRIYSYINPDYENTLLFYWKSGAGGLFLVNCLSLSERVYTLYEDIQSKVNFLMSSLDKQNIFWSDIYLTPSIVEYDTPDNIHRGKYTIIFEHDPKNVKLHLKHWNNLDIIYFKNPDLFCKIRRLLKNHDGSFTKYSCEYIKNYNEKLIPKSISHFNSLTDNIQNKLKSIFNDSKDVNSFCFLSNKRLFYVWDTNWYFSEDYTIMKVKELYDYLNFSDFNEDIIRCYYKKWITKLDELKSSKIPDNISDMLSDSKYYDIPISTIADDKLKPFV